MNTDQPKPSLSSTGYRAVILLAAGAVAALIVFWPQTPPPAPRTRPARIAASQPTERISPWRPIFVGVETCIASAEQPRLLQVRAVRIDLHEPTIDFLVTPSNGSAPRDCAARTTTEFLREFKCQVAINGSPFALPLATNVGDPLDVLGLSMSRGDLYSPTGRQHDVLLIGRDRRAWISRAPAAADGAYNGLCGYLAILVDGENRGEKTGLHPRSVAGISRDGRYLILMTIDGRQPGYSESASTGEAAEWIRKFGAYNALNLDGGGSTTLVIEGPDGRPMVLNKPSGGAQRRVANHLGVFAKRLLPQASSFRP